MTIKIFKREKTYQTINENSSKSIVNTPITEFKVEDSLSTALLSMLDNNYKEFSNGCLEVTENIYSHGINDGTYTEVDLIISFTKE